MLLVVLLSREHGVEDLIEDGTVEQSAASGYCIRVDWTKVAKELQVDDWQA
jgi:hypothetical protein